jgi:hypothetical protein
MSRKELIFLKNGLDFKSLIFEIFKTQMLRQKKIVQNHECLIKKTIYLKIINNKTDIICRFGKENH